MCHFLRLLNLRTSNKRIDHVGCENEPKSVNNLIFQFGNKRFETEYILYCEKLETMETLKNKGLCKSIDKNSSTSTENDHNGKLNAGLLFTIKESANYSLSLQLYHVLVRSSLELLWSPDLLL